MTSSDLTTETPETNENPLRTLIFAWMKQLKISKIVVEFEGSGDSGQIQGYSHTLEGSEQVHDDLPDDETSFHMLALVGEGVKAVTPKELLNDFVYACLDETGIDWYNNDGGFGDVVFFFDEAGNGLIEMEMNERYTTCDTTLHNF